MPKKTPDNMFSVKPKIAKKLKFGNKKTTQVNCLGIGSELTTRRDKRSTSIMIGKFRNNIIVGVCNKCGDDMQCGLDGGNWDCDKLLSHEEAAKLSN